MKTIDIRLQETKQSINKFESRLKFSFINYFTIGKRNIQDRSAPSL